MPMISPQDQQTLHKRFERLEGEVTITYFTQHESLLSIPGQECDYCKETRELLEEVTVLSEKLHLETKDFVRDKQAADSLGVTRIPAFVLQGRAKGAVRYFGILAGSAHCLLRGWPQEEPWERGSPSVPLRSCARTVRTNHPWFKAKEG